MPTIRTGTARISPNTPIVPLRTLAPVAELSVVVVVSFSTVTGSPVRGSYCTVRVVTVFCVEHPAVKLTNRNNVKKKRENLRIAFLPSSLYQLTKLAPKSLQHCLLAERPAPGLAGALARE
jgi:hypothetical protein